MSFHTPLAVVMVVTNASTQGWEAHLEELAIRGLWSPEEQALHIYLLELRTIWLALKAFLPSLHSHSVQILTDNTTAMWYISKQGEWGLIFSVGKHLASGLGRSSMESNW